MKILQGRLLRRFLLSERMTLKKFNACPSVSRAREEELCFVFKKFANSYLVCLGRMHI